jgi:hypothetical protein
LHKIIFFSSKLWIFNYYSCRFEHSFVTVQLKSKTNHVDKMTNKPRTNTAIRLLSINYSIGKLSAFMILHSNLSIGRITGLTSITYHVSMYITFSIFFMLVGTKPFLFYRTFFIEAEPKFFFLCSLFLIIKISCFYRLLIHLINHGRKWSRRNTNVARAPISHSVPVARYSVRKIRFLDTRVKSHVFKPHPLNDFGKWTPWTVRVQKGKVYSMYIFMHNTTV